MIASALVSLTALGAPAVTETPPPVTALAFAPGGAELVAGSQEGLAVRAWPGLEPVRRLDTELPHVHDLAFAPDGASFAAVGGEPGFAGLLELRAWPGGELLARRELADDLLYAVAWSPDGASLACAGHRGDLLVVPADGGAPRRFEGHLSPVLATAFTPDGAVLLSGGADRSLRAWDVASGACLQVLSNHTGAVRGVAARPADGAGGPPWAASIGDDRTLRLWQPTIGRLVRFARLPGEPLDLAWTPDGQRLLVTARDGHLYAVDPATVRVTADEPVLDGWAYALAVTAVPDAAPRLAVGGAGAAVRGRSLPPQPRDDP